MWMSTPSRAVAPCAATKIASVLRPPQPPQRACQRGLRATASPTTTTTTTQQHPQQQQQQQQQQTKHADGLGWQELHRAAQIAAWSSLCYAADLPAALKHHHQGLRLVASGRNELTSYYVADGVIPAQAFCTSKKSNRGSSTPGAPPAAAAADDTTGGLTGGSAAAAAAAAEHCTSDCAPDVCAQLPQGRRERFIFFRGVQWAAPDLDSTKLTQALCAIWPAQFPPAAAAAAQQGGSEQQPGGVAGPSPLVAHAGVAGIAQDLFVQLRPYIDQADDAGIPVCYAGHSLGGSLAMLTTVLHRMTGNSRRTRPLPSCYTFGSPPVLAHEAGGGGERVLQVLGMPPENVQNHVLEWDPVPRALLSADPTFELLSRWSAVKGLLWLRERLLGAGPLSPGRFLFSSVGSTHLIQWSPEGGAEVVSLDAAEVERELSMLAPRPALLPEGAGNGVGAQAAAQRQQAQPPAGSDGGQPAASAAATLLAKGVRAVLDHNSRSYAQELEAAALRRLREEQH